MPAIKHVSCAVNADDIAFIIALVQIFDQLFIFSRVMPAICCSVFIIRGIRLVIYIQIVVFRCFIKTEQLNIFDVRG